jgi:predicted outer membrane repeat protein
LSREINRAARRSEARKAKNRKSGMAALSLLATTSLMSSYVSFLRTETSFASANLASCDGVTALELDVSGAASEDVGRIQDLQIALDAAIQDVSGSVDRCVTVTFVSPVEQDTLNFTNTTGEGETRTVDTASLSLYKNDGPAIDPRIFFIGNDVTFDFSFNSSEGAFLSSPIYSELALEIHDISFVNSFLGGVSSEFAYGGVIHQAENDLSIFGSEFFGNSAYAYQSSFGGAIFFGGDDLNVVNTEFRYNFAANLTSEGDFPQISEGGAIYAASANSVTITGSVFETNGAYSYGGFAGGGAIFAGNGLIVQGSQFDTNFTFASTGEGGSPNQSITRGGAIKAGDYASISNTSFISNGSYGYENFLPFQLAESMYGGAVNVSEFATITDSTFKFNSAADKGGAIWAYSDLQISGSTFENNSADNYGGAIYLVYGAGDNSDNGSQISNSSFTSNTASSEGGALFVYNQYHVEGEFETTVSSSSFTDNSAGYQGGAIAANGYAYINTSTFVSNSSRGNGGAINLETDSIVSNSTFQENSSRFEGGAIKGGFDNEILFNTFSNNLSDSDRRFSNNKREMGESFSSEGAPSIVGNIFAGDSRYLQLDVPFYNYSYGILEYNLSTGDDFGTNSTNRDNVSLSDLGLDSELRDNETNNFSQTLAINSSSSEAYGFVPFSSSQGWGGVEAWLGGPATDQRGVLRPTSGFVNAGAFEGFISRPAPSGSGGGSSPAAFSVVIIAGPSPKAGSVVKVSGVELKKVTEVYVGQTKVKISRTSDSEISFKLPKSVTGAVTIRFVGPGIEHIHVLNIDGSVRNKAVVPGFASNSTKLTRTMKKEIKAFVESNAGLTTVTCKGFTSAPATRQDLRLARERGQATCDYIKKLNPELTVKVLAGAHTNTPGKQVRRVRLEMN